MEARLALPAGRREPATRRSSASAWRRAPSAGIMDASTLGKIEVVGPDAVEFLNRLYVNSFAKLAVGRCRYALMLSEDGYVYRRRRRHAARRGPLPRHHDDRRRGARLRGDGGLSADRMAGAQGLGRRRSPSNIATIAINGPKAREILAPLVEGIDLSPAAFPHMSVREGRVAGVAARLARVSFTGEVGFEVNVPADWARRAGGDLGRGREGRRGRLRARRAATCCAPRRAS